MHCHQVCRVDCAQDEEAEPAVPVKAERPGRDHSNVANKKTNLRSEDQTFKVQEEQRSVYILPAVTYRATQVAAILCKQPYRMLLAYGMSCTELPVYAGGSRKRIRKIC